MAIRYYVAVPARVRTHHFIVPSNVEAVSSSPRTPASNQGPAPKSRHTFTGIIGAICWFPLKAIIETCVALRIHPNVLTLVGVIINVGAAWALAERRFLLAGVVMIVANIFDFIDGKVAHRLQLQSQFGAFWDSTLDRFSDLALLTGLISSIRGSAGATTCSSPR
jgi:CDP-diacylglycerol--glycerol-3-phosphate 3-phosphatidyltransferase